MPNPRVPDWKIEAVKADILSGAYTRDEICSRHSVGASVVDRAREECGIPKGEGYKFLRHVPAQPIDKKVGDFHWRTAIEAVKPMQQLKKNMSWSQDEAKIKLGDGSRPVILMCFGDQHIGSYGSNYDEFVRLTDEILNTPDLYIALMGDFAEMAIRLRGVLEVTSQILTPEMQEAFMESWLDDMKGKIAFATWDNHAVMRQEAQGGTSGVKNLLARRCVYHNGIGHSDLVVGEQVYKCAASHKFRGGSMFNRMHAQGRYVRQQASDRELVLMGDIHQWGLSETEEGGNEVVYLTGGTLHVNSGYAKRFFSLKTAMYYPCVVLMHDRHEMIPFRSIARAQTFINGLKEAA